MYLTQQVFYSFRTLCGFLIFSYAENYSDPQSGVGVSPITALVAQWTEPWTCW